MEEKRILKVSDGRSINFIENTIYFDGGNAEPFTKTELFEKELSCADFNAVNYFFSETEIKQKIWDMAIPYYEEKRIFKIGETSLYKCHDTWYLSDIHEVTQVTFEEFKEALEDLFNHSHVLYTDDDLANDLWDKFSDPVEDTDND
ncbi:hypothetical protein OZX69_02830 [Lactobacillus sp. ESL0731]|uniref:hypothetical protein n=1 Tax=unclassified Lactobacillus TaxID=2620435 RepID=UPI0023F711AC|nr:MULTISPECIES: hypothetical protein [unclassified Lactobacillus]WEV51644.1 hypothetical protein OZX63_02830 [Lactobacillus sp. ESL0700]WEV62773.1 hypothetical protein OZX69_02830 [Lactobacillus sp. ESL0731]